MKLTFVGTRGEIEARTERHFMHTALLITHKRRRVMIDFGRDWTGQYQRVRPHAIVVTHGHPDHAFGLLGGAPCPVYAPDYVWRCVDPSAVPQRVLVNVREPIVVEGLEFEAFMLDHSTRCPAVSYRIFDGVRAVHYAPDVVYIHDREQALSGVALYIGDGATLSRSFVRKKDDALIGHAPVKTQIGWCRKSGVPRMIVTHCGTEIVTSDEADVVGKLHSWGAQNEVDVSLAYDGLQLEMR